MTHTGDAEGAEPADAATALEELIFAEFEVGALLPSSPRSRRAWK